MSHKKRPMVTVWPPLCRWVLHSFMFVVKITTKIIWRPTICYVYCDLNTMLPVKGKKKVG